MEPNNNESQNNPNTETNNTQVTSQPIASETPNTAAKSSFDFNETNVMAALSYIGPLVLIPFLTKREDSFVMFHIKQGLVLLILGLLIHVACVVLFFLIPIFMLLGVGLFILAIVGVLNALRHKEAELPLIGKYAEKIKI